MSLSPIQCIDSRITSFFLQKGNSAPSQKVTLDFAFRIKKEPLKKVQNGSIWHMHLCHSMKGHYEYAYHLDAKCFIGSNLIEGGLPSEQAVRSCFGVILGSAREFILLVSSRGANGAFNLPYVLPGQLIIEEEQPYDGWIVYKMKTVEGSATRNTEGSFS